jgi:hypothetical protein
MNGKRVALLVTGGDAFEQNAEGMFTAFERFSDFLLAKKQGGLYLGNCSDPSAFTDVEKDKAVALARSFVG